jgi:hypothetical protein
VGWGEAGVVVFLMGGSVLASIVVKLLGFYRVSRLLRRQCLIEEVVFRSYSWLQDGREERQ